MLTPEYLNLIEFNDVVNIYEKLNIDITTDIIKKTTKNTRNYRSEQKTIRNFKRNKWN